MIRFCVLLSLFLSATVFAAGDGGVKHPAAPIERADYNSLQRGAALFVSHCLGCHSLQYVRYGRLEEDLKISRALLKSRLMPAGAGVGDGMQSAASADDLTAWFNQAAPDLSLLVSQRGADWLYAYLRGFYRDKTTHTGWNNTVFPNVAMPHVLADLQGEQSLSDEGKLSLTKSGRLAAVDYDFLVADLVNFLAYAADPARPLRHRSGYLFISVLLLLLVFTYFLYREYWRDIH